MTRCDTKPIVASQPPGTFTDSQMYLTTETDHSVRDCPWERVHCTQTKLTAQAFIHNPCPYSKPVCMYSGSTPGHIITLSVTNKRTWWEADVSRLIRYTQEPAKERPTRLCKLHGNGVVLKSYLLAVPQRRAPACPFLLYKGRHKTSLSTKLF